MTGKAHVLISNFIRIPNQIDKVVIEYNFKMKIKEVVASTMVYFGVELNRKTTNKLIRYAIIHKIRNRYSSISYETIGKWLAPHRPFDHATVLHANRKAELWLNDVHDKEFTRIYREVEIKMNQLMNDRKL